MARKLKVLSEAEKQAAQQQAAATHDESHHDESRAHRKWARKNFCQRCYERYVEQGVIPPSAGGEYSGW